MAWRKSPPELIARFDRALPRGAGVERRQMFGYPAGFVNGHLFGGLHQENVIVRLGQAGCEKAEREEGAEPFVPMAGRRMREYVVLSQRDAADSAALARWLRRALAHARTLPPKPKKPSPRKRGEGLALSAGSRR